MIKKIMTIGFAAGLLLSGAAGYAFADDEQTVTGTGAQTRVRSLEQNRDLTGDQDRIREQKRDETGAQDRTREHTGDIAGDEVMTQNRNMAQSHERTMQSDRGTARRMGTGSMSRNMGAGRGMGSRR